MTPILAKVLAVENQADQYRVFVRIGLAKYRGSFNTLTFGENKPSIGFCHEGRLELVYYKDPGLKAGEPVSAVDDSVIPATLPAKGFRAFELCYPIAAHDFWGGEQRG